MIWRCKRCHGTGWADVEGMRMCLHCGFRSELDELEEAAASEPTVKVFIECEACGHKEEVADEEVARSAIAHHARGCRKAHKGIRRS